jgi:2-(1,2-epoxy-1,2-dihydrophenyl)acetyl-CoA isomerase
MSTDAVTTAADGGILRVTINRPDKLNALNADVHSGLSAAMSEAAANDGVRVVVLTGAGRAFCSGQELGPEVYRADGGPAPDLGAVVARYNPLIAAMRTLPKPIVGAVNGVAAGAGASIALACDIVIAKRSATFLQAFARIGLVPDCGSTYFLPRLVGDARARAHAMLAEPLDAATAAEWGMIWKAVEDAAFEGEVDGLARRLAAAPTYGLGLQKQAFNAAATNDLAAQLALERELQAAAGASPDYREGVGAFLAKRKPAFSGRKA